MRPACAAAFGLTLLSATTAGAAELAGSEWRPVRLGAAAWADDAGVFVRFGGDGQIAGSAGCNRFTGRYALADDTIEIGPLAATQMACPEPVMARERLLFEALERARSFLRNRTELTLADQQGREIAFFVQTDWD
jgi:heat shock protein HslJ